MKIFFIALTFLSAVILQLTPASFLVVAGVNPDLVLVLILVLIAVKSFKQLWWGVVLVGCLLDSFSGLPFGLISFSLVGAAYLVDWLSRMVFSVAKFWLTIGLVMTGVLVYNVFLITLAKIFQTNIILDWKYLLIELIYDLLIAVVFLYGVKKIFYKD